jgi:hypothetical protein
MMSHRKVGIRNALLLAVVLALGLVATAFFHLCMYSIGHDDPLDSNHHCPLCAVFSHAIITFSLSDLFASPPAIHLPILLEPISNGSPSLLALVPARAPPR